MSWQSNLVSPHAALSGTAVRILVAGQIAMFLLFWIVATPPIIPKPDEVLRAQGDLFSQGLIEQLLISLRLYVEALLLSTVFSLALSYSSAIWLFRPVAGAWAKLRFLGMTGLPFLIMLYVRGEHQLKLVLLAFSISVFTVTGMLDVLSCIPREKYDLARTMRMSEWQVLWEVEVLGRIDVAFDVVRQNAAIGWMMLGTIEGLWRNEGGIGAILMTQNKQFRLAEVVAIQITFLGLGLLQDYGIGVVKKITCPYASLLLERR